MYKELLIVFVLFLIEFNGCSRIEKNKGDNTWDILLFVQRWPQSACLLWKQKKPNNTCKLPTNHDSWVIHGIWPNKINVKDAPNFCNKTSKFDVKQLQPIESDLIQYWPNIEADTSTNSLWKHEWTKHGSCCASELVLKNELSYFGQGLNWLEEYNMTDILATKNIFPNNQKGYNVTEIHDAVLDVLGKDPMIQCDFEKKTKKSVLTEIRICFNKSLDLVDCSLLKNKTDNHDGKQLLTNCVLNKPVHYLDGSNVTEIEKRELPQANTFNLIRLYKMLQFLIWVTL